MTNAVTFIFKIFTELLRFVQRFIIGFVVDDANLGVFITITG